MNANGAHAATDSAPAKSAGRRGIRARRGHRRWPWFVVGVLVIILGAGAWVGSKVLTVRDELQACKAEVAQLSTAKDITAGVARIAEHSERAASAAQDPLWKLLESTPTVGDNLRASRLAAESVHAVSAHLAEPVLQALAATGSGSPLGRLVPPLQNASAEVIDLAQQVEQVRQSTSLIDPVREGIDQVAAALDPTVTVVQVVPRLLGADAPRNYLLVGQNNAESLALGGSAASTTLLRMDKGLVHIEKQADSSNYPWDKPVDVQVDQSALDLYGEVIKNRVNATVIRPDFPTAAQLLTAFWKRDIQDNPVDGVISVDPIALSHVLKATGPVTLPNGELVTSDNVVQLTLKDVYATNDDPHAADAYLKVVAESIFNKVSEGSFDTRTLITEVVKGIDRGSVMFWSADPEIQSLVAATAVGGVLPADNADSTTLGVFFQDFSLGSKIDYYMVPSITTSATCSADGETVFTTKVDLKLNISKKDAAKLPNYVSSKLPDHTQYRTLAYIYGPPGSQFKGSELGSGAVEGRGTTATDLGRPVRVVALYTRPGETATTTISFASTGSKFGPLGMRTTPMVNAAKISLSGKTCG